MRTSNHRARALVAALAASMALASVFGPVAAAQPKPQQVTIVSDMTVVGLPHNLGTFDTVRGPICQSGTVADTSLVWIVGGPDSNSYVLTVAKTLTCLDKTDTIFFRLLARGSGSTVPFAGGGGATNTYAGYIFD